jgi:hypothetical protein
MFAPNRMWTISCILSTLVAVQAVVTWGVSRNPPFPEPTVSMSPRASTPFVQKITHDVSNIWLTVSNYGFFGSEYDVRYPSLEFPARSNTNYIFWGGLWIGAVMGKDTIVSVGCEGWAGPHYEFLPAWDEDQARVKTITNRFGGYYSSMNDIWVEYDPSAISEQDFIAFYADTGHYISGDFMVGTNPLGLQITQRSYALSYSYAEDFIIFDFWIKNIGSESLRELYMALYLDADCGKRGANISEIYWAAEDDATGFRRWRDLGDTLWPAGTIYHFLNGITGEMDSIDVSGTGKVQSPSDLINVAWLADASGLSYINKAVEEWPTPGIAGTRVLRTPNPKLNVSYNWWYSDTDVNNDWGPVDPANPYDHQGTPDSDQQKYRIMSNDYFDPDQLDPINNPYNILNDTRYLLSFGPVYPAEREAGEHVFAPGDSVPVTLAILAGERFHIKQGIPPQGPADYDEYYDFGDLALNASWAYKVYDIPGVDTDEDGYRGDFVIIAGGDTIWLTGDLVPDFKGPNPPPSPKLRVIADDQRVVLAWDALTSEEAEDRVSFEKDFEGYRIYRGYGSPTSPLEGFTLLVQYDREIRADSANYDVGWDNWAQLRPITQEVKDRIKELWPGDSLTEYAYMYEDMGIQNYYPAYYSVTAFDYGFRENPVEAPGNWQVEPLESSYYENLTDPPLIPAPPENNGFDREIAVVPNPYRADRDYDSVHWENWQRGVWSEHDRRIDFINLPDRCVIRIYTLDGDLVQRIEHPSGDVLASRSSEPWNLISRDIQAVASGIYLFSVEERPSGKTEVGKFVIIK